MSDMTDWKTKPQDGLEAAILDFKLEFPGWAYFLSEHGKSNAVSVAAPPECEEISGVFSVELEQPSTLAEALRDVMREARKAKRTRRTRQ